MMKMDLFTEEKKKYANIQIAAAIPVFSNISSVKISNVFKGHYIRYFALLLA